MTFLLTITSMAQSTLEQFDIVVGDCRRIYADKLNDYGASWRIMRPRSITDQIYIKAKRIRTLEEGGPSFTRAPSA